MTSKIKDIIYKVLPWVVIVILLVMLLRQCSKTSDLKEQNEHNIEALTDSVKYYTDKLGDEVATKAILIGDLKTLQLANDSLATKVQAMLNGKTPQQVVYITNDIVHEKHDTCWKIDTPDMNKSFDFSDKWRELAGDVTLKDSVLGLSINKDIVHADITVAIKDGRAYVSSSNPYLHVNDIQGVTLPNQKQHRWHVGPQVGAGIGEDLKLHPYVGIGLSYSLFGW